MHLQHSTSVCLPSPAAVLLHRAEPRVQHLPVVQVTAPQWPGLRTSPLAVGYIFNGSNGWLKASAPTHMGSSPQSPFLHSAALCRDKRCSAASSKSSSMAPLVMMCCSVLVCPCSTLVSITPCNAAGLGHGGWKAAWGCWGTAA